MRAPCEGHLLPCLALGRAFVITSSRSIPLRLRARTTHPFMVIVELLTVTAATLATRGAHVSQDPDGQRSIAGGAGFAPEVADQAIQRLARQSHLGGHLSRRCTRCQPSEKNRLLRCEPRNYR